MNIRTYDPTKVTITPGPPSKMQGTIRITLHSWAARQLQHLMSITPEDKFPLSFRGTPVAHDLRPRRARKKAQEAQAKRAGIPISQYRRGLLMHFPSVTVTPEPSIDNCWEFKPWSIG